MNDNQRKRGYLLESEGRTCEELWKVYSQGAGRRKEGVILFQLTLKPRNIKRTSFH